MPVVDQALRDSPVESGKGEEATQSIHYYLNRELVVVIRKVIRFINASWGDSVDISGDHVVELGDEYIRADATDGVVTITLLPSSEAILGVRMLTLKRLNSGSNGVRWLAQGDDLVDGATTDTLSSQYELIRFRPREGGYDIV